MAKVGECGSVSSLDSVLTQGKARQEQRSSLGSQVACSSYSYSNFRMRDATSEALVTRERKKRGKVKGKAKLHQQLHEVQQRNSLMEELRLQGSVARAVGLKRRSKWKSAFDKSEGRKVRDDETLIRKSLRKEAKAKAKSRKEWQERRQQQEARMAKQQLKRIKNLQHEKHKRKEKKLTLLRKRGRIL